MKYTKQQKNQLFVHKHPRGFVLPFTMLITVLVLFITTGVLTLLSKQQYFSKIYRQTQTAYYAADDAISCAITIDDSYAGADGLGIFPSSSSSPMTYISDVLTYVSARIGTSINMNDITCGQSPIFVAGGASYFNPNFTVLPTDFEYHFINPITILPEIEYGQTSTYNMRMDLGVDPDDITGVRHLYRCAKVTVNKTVSYRQVIAQGYSSCDGTSGSIERAVVNTSVIR